MARTLSASNTTAKALVKIREHFLVKLDFATPLYFSTRGDPTYDGQAYVGANMKLELALDGSRGSLGLYDEGHGYINSFIGEIGVGCEIWALYGETGWSPGDDDLMFSGQLGKWNKIADTITSEIVESEDKWMPDIYINVENGFNHLPVDGTRIVTPDGIVELGKA